MDFQTAYGQKLRPVLDQTGQESMTKQSHKNETDINRIIRKYDKTGLITHTNRIVGQYADVSLGYDLREAMEKIQGAHDMFMELPSHVRKQFMNDVAQFVDFCEDPANLPQMRELGLANPAPPEPKHTPAPPEPPSPEVPSPEPPA